MSEQNEAWRQQARAAAEASPRVAPVPVDRAYDDKIMKVPGRITQEEADAIKESHDIRYADLGPKTREVLSKIPGFVPPHPLDVAYALGEVIHEITPDEVTFEKDGWHVKPEIADRYNMTPHDAVSHPKHYTSGSIEVWDFIIDQGLNYPLGNVVKYVCRAGKKSDLTYLEDLRKAEAYLQREMKRITDNAANH